VAQCDSDLYFFEDRDLNPLLMDADEVFFDSFSRGSSPLPSHASLNFEMERNEEKSSILGFVHTIACAISFAAGLSLGMALGACNLIGIAQNA